LHRNFRVLLAPERDERRLDPVPDRLQPMNASVAGRTEGDQKPGVVDSGPAVMDGEFLLGPAAAATAAVAG
jgi:hypothetical protein